MLFQTVDSRFQPHADEHPCVFLERDRWNDYGYVTQFRAYYADDGHEAHIYLGEVKILTRGAHLTELSPTFKRLGQEHCSLGQSPSYYANIAALGMELAQEILEALRDVVLSPSITDEFDGEEGFRTSLLRFPDAVQALKEARARYLDSPVPNERPPHVEPPPFIFSCLLDGFDAPHRILFNFRTDAGHLGRMMALVGRNGTGKTRLLAELARSVSGLGGGPGELSPDHRARVVAISFSAFDRFTRPRERVMGDSYSYYGLRRPSPPAHDADDQRQRRRNEGLVDLEAAFSRLSRSLDRIRRRGAESQDIFRSLLMNTGLLRADPRLGDPFDGEDDAQTFLEILRDAGSGHQMLAFVAAALVENVRAGTIVLFDEPEHHLHPNILATLLRLLYDALERCDAYAVLATHSPVVLQEIPARSIRIIRLEGRHPMVDAYERESFGENLSEIVQHVFGVDEDDRSYMTILKQLVAHAERREEVEALFNGLGLGPRMLLRDLFKEKKGGAR